VTIKAQIQENRAVQVLKMLSGFSIQTYFSDLIKKNITGNNKKTL